MSPGGPGARPVTYLAPRPPAIPSLCKSPQCGGRRPQTARWQGTREQEKRRQLAKRFYVAFRWEEDDYTRYARLARVLPTTYKEESTSAGSQASNGQGNGWAHLRKSGPEDQRYATKGAQVLLGRTGGVPEDGKARRKRRREAEIQISADYTEGRMERLGGGRDPPRWCEPWGKLTASRHECALQQACEAFEGCRENQVCTRPQAVSKLPPPHCTIVKSQNRGDIS